MIEYVKDSKECEKSCNYCVNSLHEMLNKNEKRGRNAPFVSCHQDIQLHLYNLLAVDILLRKYREHPSALPLM